MNFDFKTSFASDNSSGVHPAFLNALSEVNTAHASSYGMDPVSQKLERLVKAKFGPKAESFLVFNGTAANVLGLAAALRPFESVIATDCSHLNLDECGAPEKFWGSKLLLVPHKNGIMETAHIAQHLVRRGDQHFTQARAISLTQPTELGTAYRPDQIREIKKIAENHGLYLHIDGARLANAAYFLGLDLKEITTDLGVDIVSFGGTKNGMLAGELVVFLKPELSKFFKYYRKQGMNLASKSRFFANQFITYLENDFWKDIAAHVHDLAKYLESQVQDLPGVEIIAPVESNAVFAKIPKAVASQLREHYFFYVWDEFENSVRWMVSWDHTKNDIDMFVKKLKELL